MTHLGESTPITTVQSEEIVLTGADGQTFKMKVGDLAEVIKEITTANSLSFLEKSGKVPVRLYGSFIDAKWIMIGTIKNRIVEGLLQRVTLLLSGGNEYTYPSNCVLLSAVSHRQQLNIKVSNISITQVGVRFGYVVKGDLIEIWMKTAMFSQPITALLFENDSFSFLSLNQGYEPNGLVNVPIE